MRQSSMEHAGTISRIVVTVAAICIVPAIAKAVDVAEMCDRELEAMAVMGKAPTDEDRNACVCAVSAIKSDTSDVDFQLYAEVGASYFEKLANGQSRSDAWTDASKSVALARDMSLASVLEITNPLGRQHQEALKACR